MLNSATCIFQQWLLLVSTALSALMNAPRCVDAGEGREDLAGAAREGGTAAAGGMLLRRPLQKRLSVGLVAR